MGQKIPKNDRKNVHFLYKSWYDKTQRSEKMDSHLSMIIICAVFLLIGVILGNGAVWVFNRIPGKWLVDYGEEPDEELLHPSCQRIKSTPWKYVFTGFFIVVGIKMGIDNPFYAFAAVLAVWLLLEMSIADIKYMIVPDQFLLMLLVCGLGMIPQTEGGPLDCLIGAAIGLVLTGTIALIGRLVYRKSAVGGADIKLFTALGLLTGMKGILFIFVVSTFASAGHFAWLLLGKRAKRTDERPMVPYIAGAAVLYMVFFRDLLYNGFSIVL